MEVHMQGLSLEKSPVISVILPVYNGGEYLKLSVEGVLKQTLQEFELLILDDCSTDDSWKYLESLADKRIKLYKNEKNTGLFFNLNFLIKQSKSPLIKLWAQDDIMYATCLEATYNFHQMHPGIGFSYSGRDIINDKGVIIFSDNTDNTPSIISPELHARIAFYTGSIAGNIANVCISRKALDKVGLFKEKMKISADFDMWVRLAEVHDTGFIKERLIQLRDHRGQLSRNEFLYIFHVREDLEVYRYLLGYVNPVLREQGFKQMRQSKLLFYYTLMIKSFLKGNFKPGSQFYGQLASFDNIFLLSFSFLKAKLFKPHKPDFSK